MGCMTDQPARWTKATTYLDMWADPNEDPRNREDVSADGELATFAGLPCELPDDSANEV